MSFEHVPPQAAYNKSTVIEYEWEHITEKRSKKGRSLQGGVGAYTLCDTCNPNTGAWYGGEYVKWARTCHTLMFLWKKQRITFGTVTLYNVYPLRFLKQVVTCFFSVVSAPNTSTFASNNPELVQFVLDKHNTALPSGFHFFMNLYGYSSDGKTNLRRWGNAARMSVTWNGQGILGAGSPYIFDEIAHPPFELVMTEDDDPYDGATEITSFSQYTYDQQVDLAITLRVLDSSSPYPGAS